MRKRETKPNTGSRTEVEKVSNKQMNGIMPAGKLQSSNCKSLQRKLIWRVITLCPWGWKVRQLEWKGLKQLKNEIYLRRFSEIEIFFQRLFMYFNQHQAFLNWKWTWSLEIISSNQHRSPYEESERKVQLILGRIIPTELAYPRFSSALKDILV